MIFIKKIEKANKGIFREFEWPEALEGFARYNLIYGDNGSGKTTLTRLFGDPNTRLDGDKLETDRSNIKIFNTDFVKNNLLFDPTYVPNSHPGMIHNVVSYIGSDVKIQKERTECEDALSQVDRVLKQMQNELGYLENKQGNFLKEKAKYIKDMWGGVGDKEYQYFDKGRLEAILNGSPNYRELSSEKEGTCKAKIEDQEIKKELSFSLDDRFYSVEQLSDQISEVSGLLRKTVISSDTIDELAKNPAVNEWVELGFGMHEAGQHCKFCGSAYTQARKEKLASHFNRQYKDFKIQIQKKIEELSSKKKIGFSLPETAGFYSYLREDYTKVKKEFEDAVNRYNEIIEALTNLLIEKEKEVSKKMNLPDDFLLPLKNIDIKEKSEKIKSGALTNLLTEKEKEVSKKMNLPADFLLPLKNVDIKEKSEKIKSRISEHNKYRDNHKEGMNAAVRQLVKNYLATDVISGYKKLKGELEAKQKKEKESSDNKVTLREKIIRLTEKLQDNRLPLEEMNQDLASYFGSKYIQLKLEEGGGYSIKRENEPAHDLSEGEKQAIAFVYFLKTLSDGGKDQEDHLANCCVVIDDPVSSLDGKRFYTAINFIKRRLREVGQLFVLTHHFQLMIEIKKWLYFLQKSGQNTRLYQLEIEESFPRQATIKLLDPLLRKYDTEYRYFYSRLYNYLDKGSICLEDEQTIANIARKVFEVFISFQFPQNGVDHGKGQSYQKTKPFPEDELLGLLNLLNRLCHADIGSIEGYNLAGLYDVRQAVEKLMKFIEKYNPKHFEGMNKIVEKKDNNKVNKLNSNNQMPNCAAMEMKTENLNSLLAD